MANYYGTVVSEGGILKEGKKAEAEKIISKYRFSAEGEINVSVEKAESDGSKWQFSVYGDDFTTDLVENGEEYGDDSTEDFLKEIAPLLAEPFIMKEVGNEKCRYVVASAWICMPDGRVNYCSLDDAINSLIGDMTK